MNIFLTQNLTVQITIIGIKEAYYILMSEPKSNESVAKGMVNQSRWEGNVIMSKTLETWKRFGQFVCPQITQTWESFGDQHAKRFYRWVSTWVRNSSKYTLWLSKWTWIKLGSVVVGRITSSEGKVVLEFSSWRSKDIYYFFVSCHFYYSSLCNK